MGSTEQPADSVIILVRMDDGGHYYQTDLKLHDGTSHRERCKLAFKAKWIQIAGDPGDRQIWPVKRPYLWHLHTMAKMTMTRREYERLQKKLIWPAPVSSEPAGVNWLCLGDRYHDDHIRICQLLGYDWKRVTQAQLRAKLLELAGNDETKCEKYGSGPDEVMVSRAWLVQLGTNLARKRRKKKV